jgi:SPP1 gp7 family putative phage head morphogenesis protein
MVSINERFMDFQVAQQVRWIRLQNREVREALRTLRATENNLKEILAASNMDEGRFTKARLNALRIQVRNLIKELEVKLTPILATNVTDAMELAAEIEQAAFVRILPAGLDVTTPNLGVLQSASLVTPFNGAPIGEWTKAFHRSLTQTTWNTIVDGITGGMTNQEVTRGLLGTRANGFKDGALQARRRGLEALVRTSINHATNQGRQQVWKKNQSLIKGVMWVATLDTRTTPICQERDGKVGPVVDSLEWTPPSGSSRLDPPMARPPAHINCRSTTVAVTKSWKELGFNVDELPEGTRASMNGQVPSSTTYFEWLGRQGAATQKEVLGPSRLALWKKGGITPDRFQNDQGRLFTLDELKRKTPEAFEQAGL